MIKCISLRSISWHLLTVDSFPGDNHRRSTMVRWAGALWSPEALAAWQLGFDAIAGGAAAAARPSPAGHVSGTAALVAVRADPRPSASGSTVAGGLAALAAYAAAAHCGPPCCWRAGQQWRPPAAGSAAQSRTWRCTAVMVEMCGLTDRPVRHRFYTEVNGELFTGHLFCCREMIDKSMQCGSNGCVCGKRGEISDYRHWDDGNLLWVVIIEQHAPQWLCRRCSG